MDYVSKESSPSKSEGAELNHLVQTEGKSPEDILQSPLGISRYGRTRKPKITRDFCDIDDAIECTITSKSSHKRSHSKSPNKSPRKFKSYVGKTSEINVQDETKTKLPTVPRFSKILHVTGDSVSYEEMDRSEVDSVRSVQASDSSVKMRKFFKSSVEGTKLQTMTKLYINKTIPTLKPNKSVTKLENPLQLTTNDKTFESQPIDVSEVLKIFSSKSAEPKESKKKSRPILKTYSNKRKSFNKPIIIESFGLPDPPIVPLDEEISTKHVRVSEIDVGVTEPNNVNLPYKNLIDTPWEIKSEIDESVHDSLLSINLLQRNIRQLPGVEKENISANKIAKQENEDVIKVKNEKFEAENYEVKVRHVKHLNLKDEGVFKVILGETELESDAINSSETVAMGNVNNVNEILKIQEVRDSNSDTSELLKKPKEEICDDFISLKSKSLTEINDYMCNNSISIKSETLKEECEDLCDNSMPYASNTVKETSEEVSFNVSLDTCNILDESVDGIILNTSPTTSTNLTQFDKQTALTEDLKVGLVSDNVLTNSSTPFVNLNNSIDIHGCMVKSCDYKKKLCAGVNSIKQTQEFLHNSAGANLTPESGGTKLVKVPSVSRRKVASVKAINPVYLHMKRLRKTYPQNFYKKSLLHKQFDEFNFLPNAWCSKTVIKNYGGNKLINNKNLNVRDSKILMKFQSKSLSSNKTPKKVKSFLSSKKDSPDEKQAKKIPLNNTANQVEEIDDLKEGAPPDPSLLPIEVQTQRILRSSINVSDVEDTLLSKDVTGRHLRSSLNLNSSDVISNTQVPIRNSAKLDGSINESVNDSNEQRGGDDEKIKTVVSIVRKSPPENEDAVECKLGDIMWAKVGSHPYWPCLISEEPASGVFRKNQKRMAIYHVRFFGDNGRRSWVPARNLLPYMEHDQLNSQRKQEMEGKSDCAIIPPQSSGKYRNWSVGVEEAKSLIDKTVEERFGFFFDMFASKREKKIKTHNGAFKNPVGSSESCPEKNSNRGTARKRWSLRIFKKTETEPFVKKRMSPILPTDNQIHAKEVEDTDSNNGVQTEKRITRASAQNSKKNSEDRDIVSKEVSQIIHADQKKRITPQRDVLGSEYSLSDTDSSSKISGNSPVPFTLEYQVALHKRNNLFKGVTRERVCQICEKPGSVVKCRGRCSGYYHVNCAREMKKLLSDSFLQKGDTDSGQSITLDMQEIQINSSGNGGADKNSVAEFKEINEVEIIQIKDRRKTGNSPKLILNKDPDFKNLPLLEQIDHKMKEVMEKFEDKTLYADSTTDYTSSEESLPETNEKINSKQHVTGDSVILPTDVSDKVLAQKTKSAKPKINDTAINDVDFKCNDCLLDVDPDCFICHEELSRQGDSIRQKCSIFPCGKFYHPECLKVWPQTQWSLIGTTQHKQSNRKLDTFVCPVHVCHTCVSDDPRAAISRCTSDKVVKCLRCPATYHTNNYCVPAGTEILSSTQIVCPRHLGPGKNKSRKWKCMMQTVNTTWCFLCSQGGDLICCETCPTSVHVDCLNIDLTVDDKFICEDCETGRFPLYDEIVWVKLGTYRWWPAVILFPNEIPDNIKNLPHNTGEFVVKFFGTHDHYWIGRGRVFLFQEGDTGGQGVSIRKKVDAIFKRSIEEATEAHRLKKDFKETKEAEIKTGLKPPPYVKIKVNRPVGNVRLFDGNVSNTTPCECNPKQINPCGADSDCLNRLLMTECDPEVCPAGEKCQNQNFEKRKYPPLVPYKTQGRGWGLKSLEPIKKCQFVIEYVGEMIDEHEYQRRIRKMHEQKEENYYFLTIDKDRMIDAGPKGNFARFMNHSCQPNCETQKWTVNGDTRVGLFATEDVPASTELTFNYNLECVGKEKKICKCGAPNCSGFIGVKVKLDESQKKLKKPLSKLKVKKKKPPPTPHTEVNNDPCFICGKTGNVAPCHNKICTKFFHLKCANLKLWPDNKWACPWHNCNICSKRTIRCCVKCINSYCPVHSEGNVRYDKLLGFVCSEHDPTKESQEIQTQNVKKQEVTSEITEEHDVTSTTCDELEQTTACVVDQFSETIRPPNQLELNSSPKGKKNKEPVISASTSTPVKGDNASFVEGLETLSNDNVSKSLRKRGRPPKSFPEISKRIKLDVKDETKSAVVKPQNPTPSLINTFSVQNEVILSSTVPTRHLRASKVASDEDTDRFLKRHRDYEKDLPIRKRSTLRCETTI